MTQAYPRKLTTNIMERHAEFYVMFLMVGRRKGACSVYMQFVSKSSLSEVVLMESTDMKGHLYYSNLVFFRISLSINFKDI